MNQFFEFIIGIAGLAFVLLLQGAMFAVPLGIALWILGAI